jgi:hypothetical protein
MSGQNAHPALSQCWDNGHFVPNVSFRSLGTPARRGLPVGFGGEIGATFRLCWDFGVVGFHFVWLQLQIA